jgi:hypothetical protein
MVIFMSVLINIETKILDILEWGQEFSIEQNEFHQKLIETFEYKLTNYLQYNIRGFYKIDAQFDFNPITNKFILKKCISPFKFHIDNALKTELKEFK